MQYATKKCLRRISQFSEFCTRRNILTNIKICKIHLILFIFTSLVEDFMWQVCKKCLVWCHLILQGSCLCLFSFSGSKSGENVLWEILTYWLFPFNDSHSTCCRYIFISILCKCLWLGIHTFIFFLLQWFLLYA